MEISTSTIVSFDDGRSRRRSTARRRHNDPLSPTQSGIPIDDYESAAFYKRQNRALEWNIHTTVTVRDDRIGDAPEATND